MGFIERLQKYMEYRGISDNKITNDAGLSNGLIGKAKKNGGSMNAFNIEKILLAYPELNSEWLLLGKGAMLKSSSLTIERELTETDPPKGINYIASTAPITASIQSKRQSIHQSNSFEKMLASSRNPEAIPLVSVQAVGGFAGRDFSIQEHDIEGYYIIPKFRHLDVDFLIEVTGDSMMPRFFPGDIIACSIINNPRFIQWNKPYLIATREDGMIVKRLRRSEEPDCLLAVSDNEDYEPFDIPKSEIDGLARVVGVIHTE